MEKYLVLEANRTCYGLEQLGNTMTIGELIELLENYDSDMKICISNDNGYTYGEINEEDFRTKRSD